MTTWNEGVVVADTGEVIAAPGMRTEQLMSSSFGAAAILHEIEGTVHRRAEVSHVLISGNECHVIAYFANDQLEQLAVVLSDAAAERIGLRPAVNKFTDRPGEVAYLRKWVRRKTGKEPLVEFIWGKIGASFDDKGGFAKIFFCYS